MNADIDIKDVIDNVSKDFEDSIGDIDTAYQDEGWYKTTLTVARAVNLLLCFVLITCFTTGGI